MPKVTPFNLRTTEYEDWFDKNRFIYESELQAVRALLPEDGLGLEIGVGSGRFAAPLGVQFGIDPSKKMLALAAQRGIQAVFGVAEWLPFRDSKYEFALMVTTLCFLDDASRALHEAHRILKPSGRLIIAFIDADSSMGKRYAQDKRNSTFYRHAEFYTVNQVVSLLAGAGFGDFTFRQTLIGNIENLDTVQPAEKGFGQGSFVVVKGKR